MEVQVAETGPCSRSLTITVPPPLVDEHLDQMYKSAQQQVQVKGFRPGKVPKAIIEKKYGAGILAEAKEQLLSRYFGEACRSEEIAPVGRVGHGNRTQSNQDRGEKSRPHELILQCPAAYVQPLGLRASNSVANGL